MELQQLIRCDHVWPDMTGVTRCHRCDQLWPDVTSCDQCDQRRPVVTRWSGLRCDQCDRRLAQSGIRQSIYRGLHGCPCTKIPAQWRKSGIQNLGMLSSIIPENNNVPHYKATRALGTFPGCWLQIDVRTPIHDEPCSALQRTVYYLVTFNPQRSQLTNNMVVAYTSMTCTRMKHKYEVLTSFIQSSHRPNIHASAAHREVS